MKNNLTLLGLSIDAVPPEYHEELLTQYEKGVKLLPENFHEADQILDQVAKRINHLISESNL